MTDPTDQTAALAHRVQTIEQNLAEGSEKFDRIEANMAANTEKIDRIETNTAGIIEMFDALSGGIKVLQCIGRLAKPVSYIAAACTAVAIAWSKLKGGA